MKLCNAGILLAAAVLFAGCSQDGFNTFTGESGELHQHAPPTPAFDGGAPFDEGAGGDPGSDGEPGSGGGHEPCDPYAGECDAPPPEPPPSEMECDPYTGACEPGEHEEPELPDEPPAGEDPGECDPYADECGDMGPGVN